MSAFAPVLFAGKPDLKVGFFALAGLLPVTSIAFHCSGILSLSDSFCFLILPAVIIVLVVGIFDRKLMKLTARGWISGVIAVLLYDLSRVPFILAGWADFIPHISTWLSDSNENSFAIGYAWRYIGNGGGLGIVFFLTADYFNWKKYAVSSGVTFGLLIFSGLVALLVAFPDAQDQMFEITPVSFFGGLTGHIVYGWAIGKLYRLFLKRNMAVTGKEKCPATFKLSPEHSSRF